MSCCINALPSFCISLKPMYSRKVFSSSRLHCENRNRMHAVGWDVVRDVSEKAAGIKRFFSLYVPQDLTPGTYLPCPCCRSVNGWRHNSLRSGCLLRLLSQVHHYPDSLTLGNETKQPPTGVDQSCDARRKPESTPSALTQPSERIEAGI